MRCFFFWRHDFLDERWILEFAYTDTIHSMAMALGGQPSCTSNKQ